MLYADLHMHSVFSSDGKGDLFEMCEAAIERGMHAVAFTEHWDALPPDHVELPYPPDSVYYHRHEAAALEAVRDARERFHGRLNLVYAVELGQPHVDPTASRALLDTREFDFVLGSVHVVKTGIDYYYVDYEHTDIPKMFEEYYADHLRMLTFDGIDSIGHLDYPVRKMHKVWTKPATMRAYRDCIAEVLRAAIDKGVAIEINTKGCYSWFERFSPEPWVLELYRDLGGTYITTGSDAHETEHAAFEIREAADFAASIGLRVACGYTRHTPEFS